MSQDPHQGGNLSDMAVTGTTMPNDAGKMNKIPCVPRPGEGFDSAIGITNAQEPGSTLASAADEVADIPRHYEDKGATGEVETGMGNQLPATVESKRLHFTPNNPSAKGHDRDAKHQKQKDSDFEQFAGDSGTVDFTPQEEEELERRDDVTDEDIDRIVESRERKDV